MTGGGGDLVFTAGRISDNHYERVRMNGDEYHDSGEFLDLLSLDAWQALRDPVRSALAGAAPQAGPIVDLGAGSGLGTQLIAEVLPAARILAVEPSAVQRAALLCRLGPVPELRERVTVVAAAAQDVPLPDRIGGGVAMNMIGHLAPPARRELWGRLRDRLADGAPLVVNAQPPAEPMEIPEAEFVRVRVGDHTYVGSGAAQPDGPDTLRWRMRYQVLDQDGQLVREITAAYQWFVVSPEAIIAELSAAGLDAVVGPMDVVRAVAR
ncbi:MULTISPECIES: class I SAM-dependent methyltransferase [unclassified Micromonospora]|uniref:class I SAM-dependent methyltransferase n=1 Tax=unclassified Micromonospora TaxID=2617518 RepID=UPI0022B72AFC|nr:MULTISPECIES: class I SAM-dependent methyltransferase [unclassified Micromonospora]MCZ7418694.1 class I SAM-dependent methyltransferase [Verrucosispora sp. WMMA2121]WBB92396.1 class I SAM-dependent methyltransferase [Verrucosispora sp. WMMC514]